MYHEILISGHSVYKNIYVLCFFAISSLTPFITYTLDLFFFTKSKFHLKDALLARMCHFYAITVYTDYILSKASHKKDSKSDKRYIKLIITIYFILQSNVMRNHAFEWDTVFGFIRNIFFFFPSALRMRK